MHVLVLKMDTPNSNYGLSKITVKTREKPIENRHIYRVRSTYASFQKMNAVAITARTSTRTPPTTPPAIMPTELLPRVKNNNKRIINSVTKYA